MTHIIIKMFTTLEALNIQGVKTCTDILVRYFFLCIRSLICTPTNILYISMLSIK